MLEPGDQVVQKGLAARWVSNDLGMLNAVRSGAAVTTVLGDGVTLAGSWHEMVNSAGGVVLDLAQREVDSMFDGLEYEVRVGSNPDPVLCGRVRTL